MGPETGNEFTSDDVGNCSSDLFTSLRHCNHVYCQRRFLRSSPLFSSKMSDSDGYMSSSESSNVQESDSGDEMEVVGLVEPYADEPPAHSSDDEEDSEEDLDGLSPAVLRARFEREVAVNEWFVLLHVTVNKVETKLLLNSYCCFTSKGVRYFSSTCD